VVASWLVERAEALAELERARVRLELADEQRARAALERDQALRAAVAAGAGIAEASRAAGISRPTAYAILSSSSG
jgi:DNA-binding phage protein